MVLAVGGVALGVLVAGACGGDGAADAPRGKVVDAAEPVEASPEPDANPDLKAEPESEEALAYSNSVSLVRFGQELLRDAETAAELTELDPIDREREIRYTVGWLRRLLPRRVLDDLESANAEFRCVSGVGPGSDDAVSYRGSVGDYRVDVIDSRVLVLAITPRSASDGTGASLEPEVAGPAAAFEQFVDYHHKRPSVSASYQVERLSGSDPLLVGTILVDRGRGRMWFSEPITWSIEPSGRHLFVVEKVVRPPHVKGTWTVKNAPRYTDGMPSGDPRTYRRFANSNRVELARDRFRKFLQQRRTQDPVGGIKGGFDRVPPGSDEKR